MTSQTELDFLRSTGISPSKRLHLEISLGCNIKCSMCTFHDNLTKNEITPYEKIKRLDNSLSRFGVVNIGDSSEPLINPVWDKIVTHINQIGPKVSLQTNAKLIRTKDFAERIIKSNLHILRLSVDGITDSTINSTRRGTSFSAIKKTIDLINEAKTKYNSKTPYLASNSVAKRSNLEELPELVNYLVQNDFKKIRIGFMELRKPNRELVPELLIYHHDITNEMVKKVKNIVFQDEDTIFLDMAIFDKGKSTTKRKNCLTYKELLYVKYNGDASLCFGRMPIGNIYTNGLNSCLSSLQFKKHIETASKNNNAICVHCNFCQIMSFDNITDHFGKKAVEYYKMPIIQDSLRWVKDGGSPDIFWENFYSHNHSTHRQKSV